MRKVKQISFWVFLFFISCNTSKKTIIKENANEDNITFEKKYDLESDTYYYLTHIKHKDQNGKILKLEQAHSVKERGETVVEFFERMNSPILAINASTMYRLSSDTIKPTGVQIIKGKVIQDKYKKAYTLGIKDNNLLQAFQPDNRANDILNTGVKTALTAFIPLIENYTPVHDSVLDIQKHGIKKHPRQVIAQFGNLDLLILSCGGRGFDGTGMTSKDLIRILNEIEVKFAFNLDGGGSVTTVVNGELITKKIDDYGTKLRLRPNFLYIK